MHNILMKMIMVLLLIFHEQ